MSTDPKKGIHMQLDILHEVVRYQQDILKYSYFYFFCHTKNFTNLDIWHVKQNWKEVNFFWNTFEQKWSFQIFIFTTDLPLKKIKKNHVVQVLPRKLEHPEKVAAFLQFNLMASLTYWRIICKLIYFEFLFLCILLIRSFSLKINQHKFKNSEN